MVPYSNTVTAQTIIVLCISVPTFIAINIVGIRNHGFNIFYLFLPVGVPMALTPVITAIETLSYFIRLLSITLRLFANMVSGHILVKIIIYALISMPLLSLLLVPIIILEIGIAFIQAYVFLTLVISYYQDVFLPH
jgi:ATP synthase subunit 6